MNLRKKKRIVLLGLSGALAMTSLTGCKKEETALVKEAEKASEINDFYFVPNLVLIEYNSIDKKHAKVMELVSRNNNTIYFKSITDENIGAVITNFDSNDEKCIVTSIDANGNFVYDSHFMIGVVDHYPYRQFQKNGEINEDQKVPYDLIEKVEEKLESKQEDNIIEQNNKYTEDLLKYQLVIDANEDIFITTEIHKIVYSSENRIYSLCAYLEKEKKNEKIYRSITTPETSVIVKLDEKGEPLQYFLQTNGNIKENTELKVIYDFTNELGRNATYEEALDSEMLSYMSYNYHKFNKNRKEVAALEYKVENENYMRIMECLGELDNKVFYMTVTTDHTIWAVGTLNENKEITNCQIMSASLENKKEEVVSMNVIPGLTELSIEEAEKIEEDYESKKTKNSNFHLIENVNGQWDTYNGAVFASYQVKGLEEDFVMIAGLAKIEETRNLYRSVSNPNIYLEEAFSKSHIPEYRLISIEGKKEEVIETAEVIGVSYIIGLPTVLTFEEAKYTERLPKEINQEVEDSLGR